MEMVLKGWGGNGVEKICDKLIKSHSLIVKIFPGYGDPSETKITHNHIHLLLIQQTPLI